MERSYKEFLLSYENVTWAWRKASSLYRRADGPIDAAELSAFELNLESELLSIISGFRSGSYELTPLQLLPQPKKMDEDGNPRMRESFHISVRDQVASIALVNAIGPKLDSQMPRWSYGHRLYRAAWYEEVEQSRFLNTGPYRHTTRNLYRKWQHSWPLFRRQISLASRMMVGGQNAMSEILKELDEGELRAFNSDERPDYISENYWPKLKGHTLYYASIDLAKFYPKIKRSSIEASLMKFLPEYRNDQWLRGLVRRMLKFEVSPAEILSLKDVASDPPTKAGRYRGIPTGLMVAGFWSNVAMLPLDVEVQEKLARNRKIANFRFVDDHAILSSDFDALVDWIKWYKSRLKALAIGPVVSPDKYDPPKMKNLVSGRYTKKQYALVKKQCALDGRNPTKLLTKTLALVSTLATLEFDTISIHSQQQRIDELVWLLMADLPDTEIRSDTRVTFAASRLSVLVPRMLLTSDEVLHWYRKVEDALKPVKGERREIRQRKSEHIAEANRKLAKALKDDKSEKAKLEAKYFHLIFRTFIEHTDKPRLFLRLIQYCRQTGYNGLQEVFEWLNDQSERSWVAHASYLRLVAVQLLSQQAIECANAATDESRLHRERTAASRHLRNLGDIDVLPKRKECLALHPLWNATIQNYGAALRGAAEVLRSGGGRWTALPSLFDQKAKGLRIPTLSQSTVEWRKATGWTLGVWVNLLERGWRDANLLPGPIWRLTAKHSNPLHKADWSNLRKYPQHLPQIARNYVNRGEQRLSVSDAGWLWEYLGSSSSPDWLQEKKSEPYISVAKHRAEISVLADYVTLEQWIGEAQCFSETDPRASEWTALEILRLTVDSTTAIGAKIDILDNLHPSNVFVPKKWLGPNPTAKNKQWTWEAWEREISTPKGSVHFSLSPIRDYRLSLDEEETVSEWERRVRGCGLLLLSLLRKDAKFAPDWNVRGRQRDVVGFVKRQLEDMVVSSRTLGILEASLFLRSIENRLIVQFPKLFFGIRLGNQIGGTKTDPPPLRNADELLECIAEAQETLREFQISVLNHAPRQLVPMDVIQLTRSAVPIADDGT